jgi:hypothetical protein
MESLLRQRQLRLLEAICAQMGVTDRRKRQLQTWIHEGTLQEHAEKARSRQLRVGAGGRQG